MTIRSGCGEVYATQNVEITQHQNLDEVTDGFLSRLRVGVGNERYRTWSSESPEQYIDIVFLHDVFFKQSEMTWDYLNRVIRTTLAEEVDFRDALPCLDAGPEIQAAGKRSLRKQSRCRSRPHIRRGLQQSFWISVTPVAMNVVPIQDG